MTIQQCTIGDLHKLRPLALTTFWDTYGHKNLPENIVQYLSTSFDESQLKEEVEKPESEFYFIEDGGYPVGYFKINVGTAQTETMPEDHMEIERIYLLANYQGKGFGQKMIDFIKEIAIGKQKNVIWLGVWEKNPGAIAFYKKMGFQVKGKHPFVVGQEQQIDWVMKLKINP